jgi:hypothetical protein
MPQPLQHRRGATLPASLAAGEFFFKTDTQVWYSGPTGGGAPVIVSRARFGANNWTLGVFTFTMADPIAAASWSIAGVDGTIIGSDATPTADPGEWQLAGASSIALLHNAPIAGTDDLDDSYVTGIVNTGNVVRLYEVDGTPKGVGDGTVQGLLFYRVI